MSINMTLNWVSDLPLFDFLYNLFRHSCCFPHCAFGFWWDILFGKGLYKPDADFEFIRRPRIKIEKNTWKYVGWFGKILQHCTIRYVCKKALLLILEFVCKNTSWGLFLIHALCFISNTLFEWLVVLNSKFHSCCLIVSYFSSKISLGCCFFKNLIESFLIFFFH